MKELLIPGPKPRDLPWAPLVAVALVVVGYQAGLGDAEQAKKDAEYFRSLAEGCTVAFNDLAWRSSLALYYTLDAQEWLAQAREYAEALKPEPDILLVAEADQ